LEGKRVIGGVEASRGLSTLKLPGRHHRFDEVRWPGEWVRIDRKEAHMRHLRILLSSLAALPIAGAFGARLVAQAPAMTKL